MAGKLFYPLVYLVATLALWPVCACSRVLLNSPGGPVVVGRNMDWINSMPVDFYVIPRGLDRTGMVNSKPAQWKSKYGLLALVRNGAGVMDGINEKSLSGHMLWLGTSDYGIREKEKPAISLGIWLQYCLENYASVKEVAESFEKNPIQIVTTQFDGLKASTHLAFEDASGDSLVLEYQGGKAKVYHSRLNTVMTNDPVYSKQLENLKNYKGFGGMKSLPGSNEPADRFVRAAFYLQGLPKPANGQEAVAYMFSVIRNVSQPFGEVNAEALRKGQPHNSPTRWRTVIHHTDGVFYYESTVSPDIIWVNHKQLDFSLKAGLRKLDLQEGRLIGDCTEKFKPSEPFTVLKAE